MASEEKIKIEVVLGETQSREFYEADPIFNRMQWEMRSCYEESWRQAGGDPVDSHHTEAPVGWRLSWLNSKARAFLVTNGLISGKDAWR